MATNGNGEDKTLATLQQIKAHRTIYALCELSEKNKLVRATHYVTCLIGGRAPLWGVFSAQTERLVRLCDGRAEVEAAYPTKVWRVRETEWQMTGKVTMPHDHDQKEHFLDDQIS